MSRTNLHHILAVLTHYTYTIPLVELGDLLKRHFPANRCIKAFNMSNKFDKSRINLIKQHSRSSEQVCVSTYICTVSNNRACVFLNVYYIYSVHVGLS